MNNKILPQRRYHKTPRPIWSDFYTINSFKFEDINAIEQSKYYGTFRKFPKKHEPFYNENDNRIVFSGLQTICDLLFYDPITHQEIDESLEFLKNRKVKNDGTFENVEFPENLWRRVVNEFGGYLPLKVTGMPEGSVVYPNEPFLRIEATEPGFGSLVPWFESTLLHVWAATERLTASRHFLMYMYELIRKHEPESVTNEECLFLARLTIHDFGDRAAASSMESELVGKVHNYVWFGTDTLRGAYQNWKNGAPPSYGSSVKALAHRIVQGFENEEECYNTMYVTSNKNEILSMVGDCYDYWGALRNYLIPLAQHSKKQENGPTIVARPDSGDSIEMVVGTLKAAKEAGLMETYKCSDGTEKYVSTTLRYIIGNGESFESVMKINEAVLSEGFLPWRCGIYGIGGHSRNNISRDHLSTKFALCSVGKSERPVIKLSNEIGKRTLPNCKVIREKISLQTGVTLISPEEPGDDALVVYYNGSQKEPFGLGFTEQFLDCENRIINTFETMPKNAGHVSEKLSNTIEKLIKQNVK